MDLVASGRSVALGGYPLEMVDTAGRLISIWILLGLIQQIHVGW